MQQHCQRVLRYFLVLLIRCYKPYQPIAKSCTQRRTTHRSTQRHCSCSNSRIATQMQQQKYTTGVCTLVRTSYSSVQQYNIKMGHVQQSAHREVDLIEPECLRLKTLSESGLSIADTTGPTYLYMTGKYKHILVRRTAAHSCIIYIYVHHVQVPQSQG